mgnify:CR=1 FL=1
MPPKAKPVMKAVHKPTADFTKTRRKVGRKLEQQNATKISFTAKAIDVPLQANLDAKTEPTNSRNLTLSDLLQQTVHYSPGVRRDAYQGMAELFTKHRERDLFATSLSTVLARIGEGLVDVDPGVRRAVCVLCFEHFPSIPPAHIAPRLPMFLRYVSAGLSHYDAGVRADAVQFFRLALMLYPSLTARFSPLTLPNFPRVLADRNTAATAAASLSSSSLAAAAASSALAAALPSTSAQLAKTQRGGRNAKAAAVRALGASALSAAGAGTGGAGPDSGLTSVGAALLSGSAAAAQALVAAEGIRAALAAAAGGSAAAAAAAEAAVTAAEAFITATHPQSVNARAGGRKGGRNAVIAGAASWLALAANPPRLADSFSSLGGSNSGGAGASGHAGAASLAGGADDLPVSVTLPFLFADAASGSGASATGSSAGAGSAGSGAGSAAGTALVAGVPIYGVATTTTLIAHAAALARAPQTAAAVAAAAAGSATSGVSGSVTQALVPLAVLDATLRLHAPPVEAASLHAVLRLWDENATAGADADADAAADTLGFASGRAAAQAQVRLLRAAERGALVAADPAAAVAAAAAEDDGSEDDGEDEDEDDDEDDNGDNDDAARAAAAVRILNRHTAPEDGNSAGTGAGGLSFVSSAASNSSTFANGAAAHERFPAVALATCAPAASAAAAVAAAGGEGGAAGASGGGKADALDTISANPLAALVALTAPGGAADVACAAAAADGLALTISRTMGGACAAVTVKPTAREITAGEAMTAAAAAATSAQPLPQPYGPPAAVFLSTQAAPALIPALLEVWLEAVPRDWLAGTSGAAGSANAHAAAAGGREWRSGLAAHAKLFNAGGSGDGADAKRLQQQRYAKSTSSAAAAAAAAAGGRCISQALGVMASVAGCLLSLARADAARQLQQQHARRQGQGHSHGQRQGQGHAGPELRLPAPPLLKHLQKIAAIILSHFPLRAGVTHDVGAVSALNVSLAKLAALLLSTDPASPALVIPTSGGGARAEPFSAHAPWAVTAPALEAALLEYVHDCFVYHATKEAKAQQRFAGHMRRNEAAVVAALHAAAAETDMNAAAAAGTPAAAALANAGKRAREAVSTAVNASADADAETTEEQEPAAGQAKRRMRASDASNNTNEDDDEAESDEDGEDDEDEMLQRAASRGGNAGGKSKSRGGGGRAVSLAPAFVSTPAPTTYLGTASLPDLLVLTWSLLHRSPPHVQSWLLGTFTQFFTQSSLTPLSPSKLACAPLLLALLHPAGGGFTWASSRFGYTGASWLPALTQLTAAVLTTVPSWRPLTVSFTRSALASTPLPWAAAALARATAFALRTYPAPDAPVAGADAALGAAAAGDPVALAAATAAMEAAEHAVARRLAVFAPVLGVGLVGLPSTRTAAAAADATAASATAVAAAADADDGGASATAATSSAALSLAATVAGGLTTTYLDPSFAASTPRAARLIAALNSAAVVDPDALQADLLRLFVAASDVSLGLAATAAENSIAARALQLCPRLPAAGAQPGASPLAHVTGTVPGPLFSPLALPATRAAVLAALQYNSTLTPSLLTALAFAVRYSASRAGAATGAARLGPYRGSDGGTLVLCTPPTGAAAAAGSPVATAYNSARVPPPLPVRVRVEIVRAVAAAAARVPAAPVLRFLLGALCASDDLTLAPAAPLSKAAPLAQLGAPQTARAAVAALLSLPVPLLVLARIESPAALPPRAALALRRTLPSSEDAAASESAAERNQSLTRMLRTARAVPALPAPARAELVLEHVAASVAESLAHCATALRTHYLPALTRAAEATDRESVPALEDYPPFVTVGRLFYAVAALTDACMPAAEQDAAAGASAYELAANATVPPALAEIVAPALAAAAAVWLPLLAAVQPAPVAGAPAASLAQFECPPQPEAPASLALLFRRVPALARAVTAAWAPETATTESIGDARAIAAAATAVASESALRESLLESGADSNISHAHSNDAAVVALGRVWRAAAATAHAGALAAVQKIVTKDSASASAAAAADDEDEITVEEARALKEALLNTIPTGKSIVVAEHIVALRKELEDSE